MKRIAPIAVLLFALAPAALFANPGAPVVSNVRLVQPISGTARVTFDLDEDAVVTAEFFMDGVALPAETVQTLSGDVNCKVAAGVGRSFSWNALADWPDHTVEEATVRVTAWAPLAPPDYMAVDLRADAEAPRVRYYATSNAVPGGVTNRLYKSDVLLMRRIPAAMVRHRQGSPVGAYSHTDMEVAHYCTLSKDYYMGVYEFTEAQYALVGGTRYAEPSWLSDADKDYYPLIGVFYKNNVRGDVGAMDAPTSASIIGGLRSRTGLSFDLPTDAQWEYAARAGATTTLYDGTEAAASGDGLANVERLAWCKSNSGNKAHEVGLKPANAFGLYDVLGNAEEWCLDGPSGKATPDYVSTDDVVDPVHAFETQRFVLRGGCYKNCHLTSAPCNTLSFRGENFGGCQGEPKDITGFRAMCPIPAQP